VRSPAVRYLSPRCPHPFGDAPGMPASTSCARTAGCFVANHGRHHLIIHESSQVGSP
jgi:hypothetical protein